MDTVMRPMLLAPRSANHIFWFGPTTTPNGALFADGIGNSLRSPLMLIRPMLFPDISANQRFPSGPAVIPPLLRPPVVPVAGNSVNPPLVVRRPILFEPASVNQR